MPSYEVLTVIGTGNTGPTQGLRGFNPTPTPVNGDVASVAKYEPASTTTDSGGLFILDAASTEGDDGGTVIQPPVGIPGRWKRLRDIRGTAHAEWFGAKANGIDDDSLAIQTCLDKLNSVTLLAKTYRLKPPDASFATKILINLLENHRIQGQGIDKTIVKLDFVNTFPTKNEVIGFGTSTACFNATIRDLTIDCGFGQNSDPPPPTPPTPTKRSTRHAINLQGDNTCVERVKVVNFGVGNTAGSVGNPTDGTRLECFPIALRARTPSGGIVGTIKDCIVTQPGNSENLYGSGIIPEITCLLIAGYIDFSNYIAADIGYGGRLVGNRIYDMAYSSVTQRCGLHGLMYSQCIGAEIADNEVINFDGPAVYLDSWRDEEVVIRNNRFINVGKGVSINAHDPGQHPSHSRTRIIENVILLGKYQNLYPGSAPFGVELYVNDTALPNPPPASPYATYITDITVERNFVRGGTVDGLLSFGVFAYAGRFDNFSPNPDTVGVQRVSIFDNIFDLPDAEMNGWFRIPGVYTSASTTDTPGGEPYEEAILVKTKELYLKSIDQLRLHGNRSLASTSVTGPDERLKLSPYDGNLPAPPYNARGAWGAFSTRLLRFQSPVFDGRAGLLYDDFVGGVPGSGLVSALRWTTAVQATGIIAGENSDATTPGPGIVRLETGASASGAATLRYASNAVIFNSNAALGNWVHILECSLKRSDFADLAQNYECLFGFLDDFDQGIQFRINYNLTGNTFKATTQNQTGASGTFFMTPILLRPLSGGDVDFTVDTNPPSWTTLRIEVLRYPGSDWTARFFVNGKYSGKINSSVNTHYFPIDIPLYCGFRIRKMSGTSTRKMWVDYFQHQIVPAT